MNDLWRRCNQPHAQAPFSPKVLAQDNDPSWAMFASFFVSMVGAKFWRIFSPFFVEACCLGSQEVPWWSFQLHHKITSDHFMLWISAHELGIDCGMLWHMFPECFDNLHPFGACHLKNGKEYLIGLVLQQKYHGRQGWTAVFKNIQDVFLVWSFNNRCVMHRYTICCLKERSLFAKSCQDLCFFKSLDHYHKGVDRPVGETLRTRYVTILVLNIYTMYTVY